MNDPVNTSESQSPFRRWWAAGQQTVGTWCSLPAPAAVEAVAQSGFDWVIVDWQHGHFGGDSLGTMILVASHAGAVPIVRVPLNDPWLIQKALDLGAYGVVVPLVNSVEEAQRAAAATRYPPQGVRSFGPIRASRSIGWEPEAANREVVCIVQIETAEALAAVEQIAAVDGVDALFVGPADMAISLGLPLGAPELEGHLAPVLAAARNRGLPLGRHVDAAADAPALFEAGYSFLAVGGDSEFLGEAAARAAVDARAGAAPARGDVRDNVCRLLVSSAPPAP
jgi:4-hydroxy-2-oxoheptanedioate aldolase